MAGGYPTFQFPSIGWLRSAAAGGGIILAAASFVGGTFTGEQVEPLERVGEVASSPASRCPDGWRDTSEDDRNLDVRVLSCSREGWIVWLRPDGSFNYAWSGSGPFIFDSTKVAGWP